MADAAANNLLRIAQLTQLLAVTIRTFSDTDPAGNGRISRLTELSRQMELVAVELKRIAENQESETNGS